jgi:hypothetical protein
MLTHFELRLAAKLLEMAGDQFGNHGCNDFDVIEEFGIAPEDAIDLDRKVHELNGDPEEHDPDMAARGFQQDFRLMFYLSERFEQEAKAKEGGDQEAPGATGKLIGYLMRTHWRCPDCGEEGSTVLSSWIDSVIRQLDDAGIDWRKRLPPGPPGGYGGHSCRPRRDAERLVE